MNVPASDRGCLCHQYYNKRVLFSHCASQSGAELPLPVGSTEKKAGPGLATASGVELQPRAYTGAQGKDYTCTLELESSTTIAIATPTARHQHARGEAKADSFGHVSASWTDTGLPGTVSHVGLRASVRYSAERDGRLRTYPSGIWGVL